MVKVGETECPNCGGELRFWDMVNRLIRYENGDKEWTRIRRMKCKKCGKLHRELPDYILPFKQYDAEIIKEIQNGSITSDDLGYENYPTELTMLRWKKSRDEKS